MRQRGVRFCVALLCLAAPGLAPATAAAAAPGFTLEVVELPGDLTAGAQPATVTAVVSTDRQPCRKVRWSLVARANGLRLDQVRVERFEDFGTVPLVVRAEGDGARLTDVPLDPGILCPGSTVTARYRVAVDDGATDGAVTLRVEAFDANRRLLADTSVSREVVSGRGAAAPADPGPPVTEPAAPAPGSTSAAPGIDAGPGAAPAARVAAADSSGLARIGLIVGAFLIFLGITLLLRLRHRLRAAEQAGAGPVEPVTAVPMVGAGAGRPAGRRHR